MVLISSLFHVIVSLFSLLAITETFIVLRYFDSMTARFFGVQAARFHLFCFCFMYKYDSR